MKTVLEAHKFFCRKSQHYILGDWVEYQDAIMFKPDVGYVWNKQLFRYYFGFIPAYIRFMYYTLKEELFCKPFHN